MIAWGKDYKIQGIRPPGRSRLPRHLTVDDVRANQEVISHVDEQIKQLGLSDFSSEDEEDVFTRLGRQSGKGKTLRSGKAVKLTSRVVCPQIWPHSELSLLYVSKDLCYDNLAMAEFVAGFASILRLPCLSSTEWSARIDHLATLSFKIVGNCWDIVVFLRHANFIFFISLKLKKILCPIPYPVKQCCLTFFFHTKTSKRMNNIESG